MFELGELGGAVTDEFELAVGVAKRLAEHFASDCVDDDVSAVPVGNSTNAIPQALATPQYTAQWGFADWGPYITDWSRDLFDGGAVSETAFAVAPEGALRVVSFDRMSREDAAASRDALRPDPA